MNYYHNGSSDVIQTLVDLNQHLNEELNKDSLDNEKILKLRQQILMKGIQMSTIFSYPNHNLKF